MIPFDPSKMDPKALMEISQLIQQLPPEQLNRMQRLMHNMMAGFDVKKEMEEFENSLPPDFREKLLKLAGGSMSPGAQPITSTAQSAPDAEIDLHQARLTVLRAVQEGSISPEEAEKLLFPE
ncbi:MAG TPA: hypothetical protein DCS07_13520 [Bdellovibrionales bacterium]|nr:MAG: hypothetical protein A2Z97_05155 [Bdellovibrionales bacterium GWB1_52_6]OFZ04578.1 MAG: hypothetical protein A2X97_13230 [Bdellovibrionales bacterium GWA1_52_35]OFZ42955.1 MAG: hypothetical protein A2070_10390 [Bdellovibrionales bacterium GWC1_52_8]HAR43627.1 hypothetical protein [Bdellovibrionales bacterium]HCM39989.1 hypothetical protein [Bdellovibrionales bacterium]